MEFIEACLLNSGPTEGDLEQRLSFLQRVGIHHFIFSDFFGLRSFGQRVKGLDLPIGHLSVISYANIDSIKMIWNLINSYDLFTIFLQHSKFVGDDECKDALYYVFSITDNVGCAMEAEALLSFPLDDMVRTLQDEFRVDHFLVLDNEGLLLPKETSRCLKTLRSKILKESKIFYFPNDNHALGLMNALYAMRLGIDGLVGSALNERCDDPKIIDLMKLHLLYQQERNHLFSKHSIRLLDQAFSPFIKGGEKGIIQRFASTKNT